MENNVVLCLECKEVPQINFCVEDNRVKMKSVCGCGEKVSSINNFENYITNSLSNTKITCVRCDDIIESITYVYCNKCQGYVCNSCKKYHGLRGKKHVLKNIDRFPKSLCKAHQKEYSQYCYVCKTPICKECQSDHTKHSQISISQFLPKDKFKHIKKENERVYKEYMKYLQGTESSLIYLLESFIRKIKKTYNRNITRNMILYENVKILLDNYKKFHRYNNYNIS